ncbi:hypothetical protein RHSIM_Rhsim03G0163400 [Rhododendron simsii]|uniref:Uncharacterized protein n=1 Tax=Rhododendron simsii TaxID=118357 RepID=A0A834H7F6_RHOSS|nr:hypothetical protein RHSIM_Rhsim03G0163400 [Rhododendron simsii]
MDCNSILSWNVVTGREFDVVGHLVPENIPVFGQYYWDRDVFDRVWYFSHYTHPSILRSFCKGESPTGLFTIVFERFSHTLPAYRKLLNQSPGFASTSFYGRPHLPMVTSGVKDLLRKLMEFLKYIHKENNIALGGFNFNNIVVVRGTPKLFNVNAQINDDSNIAADFQSFAEIINFLYEWRMIPGELRALQAKLWHWAALKGRGICNADLIYDHPSLWDEARCLAFRRNFVDWRPFVPSSMLGNYHDAIRGMNLPRNASCWQHFVPPQSAFISCFKYKVYNETPEDLASFQRNCVAHIARYSENGTMFNQFTLEAMMQDLFPMHLVELVSRLYERGFSTTFFTL